MRKLILVIGIVCCVVWLLPIITVAKIDPETAVGVWLFDDGSGNSAEDSSGKGHEGSINGASWTDGKFGEALEFDGNDWVSIDSTPELQIGEAYTLMAWFYATDIGNFRAIISKHLEYLMRINGPGESNVIATFVHLSNGGWEPRATAGVPDLNTWIHYVVTFDSNENTNNLLIYVDGEQAGTSSRTGASAPTQNPVAIGRWNTGSYFVGIIDDVAIFNTALSEEDINTIKDHGLDAALSGVSPVEPTNKLTTTWGNLKSDR